MMGVIAGMKFMKNLNMKTRLGFVSNSSSSSFVLKVGAPFDTVKEVAEYMIPKRGWDNDEELLKRINKSGDTTAISFASCNYDTFIAKMGDYFLIETCHNHNWDLLDFVITTTPPEFIEQFGDDSFYELPHKLNFYNLDYDVYGRVATWEERERNRCKKHSYSDLWIVNNKFVCLECKSEKK